MILYSLVAKGSLVIAEYSPYEEDFSSIAQKILMKNQSSSQKKIVSKEGYAFSYFSENNFTFLCLTKTDVPKHVAFKFLDTLTESFFCKYGKTYDNEKKMSQSAQITLILKQLMVY